MTGTRKGYDCGALFSFWWLNGICGVGDCATHEKAPQPDQSIRKSEAPNPGRDVGASGVHQLVLE
jgi:hypothetical protein